MRIHRFFDAIYADNRARRADDRRFVIGDLARYLRNSLLRPLDDLLVARHADDGANLSFIVGAPRSGTTLLFQLLVRHLHVAYPSNELARFWSAPLVGAHYVERSDDGQCPEGPLESSFGRDPRAFGPHEFSWFWHYWGDFRDYDDIPMDSQFAVDWPNLTRRLSALANRAGVPFVSKSINFTNYHVEILAKHLPNARFLWIRRDPYHCARSILEARRSRYDDPSCWWSVRPRDWTDWQGRTPEDQVAHQIADIDAALTRASHMLGADRMQAVSYESLVDSPEKTLRDIAQFLDVGIRSESALDSEALEKRNGPSTTSRDTEALIRALAKQGLVGDFVGKGNDRE